MAHTKRSFWEISFYAALLLILLWLILKITGIINTPPLLEYGFPIISAMYALFAIYRDLLDRIERIGRGLTKAFMRTEHNEERIAVISQDVKSIEKRLSRGA